MSKGINKVILIGSLGNDPESRELQNGMVTNISIATSESWKDKQNGEQKEKTEWHKVAFFGRLAEVAAQYLKKGSKVYVEGSLETKKYQAQDGTDRWSTQIKAREMQMLDSKGDNAQPVQSPSPAPTPAPQQQQQVAQPEMAIEDFDEDIPF